MLEALRRGDVSPDIAVTFPFARAAEALRFTEEGGHTGKVVLTVEPPAPPTRQGLP